MVRAGESEIRAVIGGARSSRRPSRGLWIAAAVVGGICLFAFVVVLLSEPAPVDPAQLAREPPPPSGPSFASGLAIGAALGIAIGFVIARRLARQDRQ